MFKERRHFSIVIYISFSFLSPIFRIFTWASISAIMAMPKTSIDKYGYTFFKENKIRMAFNLIVSPPSSNMMAIEVTNKSHLCTFIARRFYAFHYLRAFFF